MDDDFLERLSEQALEKYWKRIKTQKVKNETDVPECSICKRTETEIRLKRQKWEIEEYVFTCPDCGKELVYRRSSDTGNSNLYLQEDGRGFKGFRCDKCGRSVNEKDASKNSRMPIICGELLSELKPDDKRILDLGYLPDLRYNVRILEHHHSYVPEKTMKVCHRCHTKIHYSDDHNQFEPDLGRGEWESYKREANRVT